MRKAVLFLFVVTLCLTALCGCTEEAAKADPQEELCRVLCIKEDGIVVEIPSLDVGCVYVKLTNDDLEIEPLDTVVIEFSSSDLKSESGEFTDPFGEEQAYSYVLENHKNVRLADTSVGEPTFG